MRYRIALAMLVVLAVGCGGGTDDAAPITTTTTTKATTTTVDPAPMIRRYASAVAPALARFTSGKVCSSRPTCAMEQATAWEGMMDDLEQLAGELPPEEIRDLVFGILEADRTFRPHIDAIIGCIEDYQSQGDPAAALTECDPLVTVFDAWVADAASTLERWRPYV